MKIWGIDNSGGEGGIVAPVAEWEGIVAPVAEWEGIVAPVAEWEVRGW